MERSIYQFLKFKVFFQQMRFKYELNYTLSIRKLYVVPFSLNLNTLPSYNPKMSFGQLNVATSIHNIPRGNRVVHCGSFVTHESFHFFITVCHFD